MTVPGSTSSLNSYLLLTINPAAVNSLWASSLVFPLKFAKATCSIPLLIIKSTELSFLTGEPLAGFQSINNPASNVALYFSVTRPTFRFKAESATVADSIVNPTKSGTFIRSSPFEITK